MESMKHCLLVCLIVFFTGCTRVVEVPVSAPPIIADEEFISYDTPPVPDGGFPGSMERVRYPIRAQRYGIEGTVVVVAYINENGFATDVKVAKGVPSFGLNETAVQAIRQTHFKPAMRNHKPVGSWVSIPVKFRLPLEKRGETTYDEEETADYESPSSIYHERYSPEERMAFKRTLAYLGYDVDPKSPDWLKRTDKALRQFQEDHGLTPDGKIGPITMFALENAMREEAVISVSKQDYASLPVYSDFWVNYVKGKKAKKGELLKYYDYETGEFKYAEIEFQDQTTVKTHNYKIQNFYIDITDENQKKPDE